MKKKTNKVLAKDLTNIYSDWKNSSLETSGYFVIFNGFQSTNKLKNISGNALKLYIYLGLNSKNFTGEVWHSNAKIAKYFNKSERTVRYWMQELESLNLIKRFQLEYNGESHIFLQPYDNSRDSLYDNMYIYKYRLKNTHFRKTVDLRFYKNELYSILNLIFPKSQSKINKDYIQINSYKPLETNSLRKFSSTVKNNIPDFSNYVLRYEKKNSNGDLVYSDYLFERIKSK